MQRTLGIKATYLKRKEWKVLLAPKYGNNFKTICLILNKALIASHFLHEEI
jgi:hypothetical protein